MHFHSMPSTPFTAQPLHRPPGNRRPVCKKKGKYGRGYNYNMCGQNSRKIGGKYTGDITTHHHLH